MLSDTYVLIYLITNLFSIAILHKFMQAFFDNRITKNYICGLSYTFYVVATSCLYLFVDIPLLTLLSNWIIIFGITFNYEAKTEKRLLISIYILLFMAIIELLVSTSTGYFHFPQLTEGNYSNSVGVICARLLTFMTALLSKNFRAVKKNKMITKNEWAASVFIPVTTMILEIIVIQADNISQNLVLLSLMLVFILNLIAFYLYDSLSKSYIEHQKVTILQKENQLYSKQCEMMQSATENLQSFRHDLNNQFTVITELLDKKEYDLVRKQIASLANITNSSVIYSTTGNIIIDGLINYKLQIATNGHIQVDSEIAVPCDLEINTTDIVSVIGNLLDNALQAVMELEEEKRSIYIKVVYSQDRLIIQTINPYKNEIEYQNGEIISTKEDKANHGFGLKNIEKIVEKYDGYMEICTDKKIFKIDILLYLIKSD